jgi:Ca2+-binding RTX toxin-like protein
MDTIWLGSNLSPEDIVLKRLGYNLVLNIEDTSDTLTVRGFFSPESSVNRVERIQFMDGTVWTDSDIIRQVYAPTDGDDTIYGGIENDNLNSLGGNDTIYGRGGDDTLEGGTGRDTLYGEGGNDTLKGGFGNDGYLFSPRRKFFIDFSREDPWWRCREVTNRGTPCQVG